MVVGLVVAMRRGQRVVQILVAVVVVVTQVQTQGVQAAQAS